MEAVNSITYREHIIREDGDWWWREWSNFRWRWCWSKPGVFRWKYDGYPQWQVRFGFLTIGWGSWAEWLQSGPDEEFTHSPLA